MSTFGGLSIASSGLAAQRRAIEVAGHNVANANTPGYSRQRVDMSSITGGSTGIHTGPRVYGGGVAVTSQSRIVDSFLINRSNSEWAAKGTTDAMAQTFNRLEAAFNEPGDAGLASQLQSYWDAWDAVAATPEDLGARAALLQRGAAISGTFQDLSRTFDLMKADVLQRAEVMVTDINAIAGQVAGLNDAISAAIDNGAPPNDLLDQRDELVRQLSNYVGVTTRLDDTGRMDISIGGVPLVSGTRTTPVSLHTSDPDNAVLRSASSDAPLDIRGGQVDGLLQSANTTIPNQQRKLDEVADALRLMVNAQHGEGSDLQEPPVQAGEFFIDTGAGGAAGFAVNPALVENPRLVGAAALGEGRFGAGNAVALAELATSEDGPDKLYRSMMADLGVLGQTANRRADTQDQLTLQIDRQREQVSGVSLDEEMANLVAYQQAYQASARFMSAIDEMLTTLLNVGR